MTMILPGETLSYPIRRQTLSLMPEPRSEFESRLSWSCSMCFRTGRSAWPRCQTAKASHSGNWITHTTHFRSESHQCVMSVRDALWV